MTETCPRGHDQAFNAVKYKRRKYCLACRKQNLARDRFAKREKARQYRDALLRRARVITSESRSSAVPTHGQD